MVRNYLLNIQSNIAGTRQRVYFRSHNPTVFSLYSNYALDFVQDERNKEKRVVELSRPLIGHSTTLAPSDWLAVTQGVSAGVTVSCYED